MLVDIIAGARPNFMKIAPIIHEIKRVNSEKLKYRLIHTGQHYDKRMSADFFDQLNIPEPDVNLESGSGTQAEQTAKIMVRYEKLLLEEPSDLTLVVGDVNSTMACSIVAKKLKSRVAHVEGGIRSFDLGMPEEINRMVTDSISDYFFTTSATANHNLKKEGISDDKVFFVGNTMIDTLLANRNRFVEPPFWSDLGLASGGYIVMTLHRPANVDEEENLIELISTILANSAEVPFVFPIHPRTAQVFKTANWHHPRLHLVEPLPYLEFNYLVENSMGVITDSGGITEETTVMGVPCMTLRDNTERPETCTLGTNELLGTDPKAVIPAIEKLLSGEWKKGDIPPLWDGKCAERIVEQLSRISDEF